jgi:hypothetical protein
VVIGDKIPGIVLFGKFQRRFYGAKIIADVEVPGGLDSCKGYLHNRKKQSICFMKPCKAAGQKDYCEVRDVLK